jgi:hypothetical protein
MSKYVTKEMVGLRPERLVKAGKGAKLLHADCKQESAIKRRTSAPRALVRVPLCDILLSELEQFVQLLVLPLPRPQLSDSADSGMSANQSQ